MPQAITITVPDNYPETMLRSRIRQIEDILEKEAESLANAQKRSGDTATDPWDALDLEAIAVDTGHTDGSVNHDHYIYGTPKK